MRRTSSVHDVTLLLRAWSEGDSHALNRLVPLDSREPRRIARGCMASECPNHTLQATAIANETYLRLVDAQQVCWQDRTHFFALCARAMRRNLVDHARSRASAKRGAGLAFMELDEGQAAGKSANLLGLDAAHSGQAALDPRKSLIVELRFCGGLCEAETAAVVGISPETVRRGRRLARVWFYRELRGVKANAA